MIRSEGYALFIVLTFMTLVFILTAVFSANLRTGARQARTIAFEAQALSAADGGVQYALEAERQKIALKSSAAAAPWNLLSSAKGNGACFKVYTQSAGCPAGQICVTSVGETAAGACGDYPGASRRILAARILQARMDSAKFTLTAWQEALPP